MEVEIGDIQDAENDFVILFQQEGIVIPENIQQEVVPGIDQSRRGRRSLPIWDEFITTRDGDGKISMNKCKYCNLNISPQTPRMTKHIQNCKVKFQKPILSHLVTASSNIDVPEPNYAINFAENQAINNIQATHRTQPTIKNLVKALPPKSKEDLDKKCGQFIFSSNLAFNVLENVEFQEFCRHLNPAYKLPSPDVISTRVLKSVFAGESDSMKIRLRGAKVCIQQDGWSTIQNEPIIAHCISNGKESHYLDSINPEMQHKTADYLFSVLEEAVKKAETQFDCKVVGVVTDNCSTMVSMHRIINEKYPNMYTYGCNAHLFNLIGEKFTPKDLQDKVNQVQSFIRNHH